MASPDHTSTEPTSTELTGAEGERRKRKHKVPGTIIISSQNAVTVGFLGAIGVMIALLLGAAIENSVVILTYIGTAVFIALGLEPLVRKLISWKFPRPLAIITVFVTLTLALVGILAVVIPAIINQIDDLAAHVPQFYSAMSTWDWYQNIDATIRDSADQIVEKITTFFSDPQRVLDIAGGVLSVSAEIANGFVAVIIVLVLTLYFMASLDGIKRTMASLLPASRRERFNQVSSRIFDTVGQYVIAQVTVALVHGVLAYIVMSIIGIRFREVLAVLGFLLALLPMIGTVAAAVIVTVTTLVTVVIYGGNAPELWKVAAIGIYYLVYMQLEGYVIGPRLMTHSVKIPGVIIVVAALLGGALMGLLGAVIAVPVAASIIILINELWIPRQDRR